MKIKTAIKAGGMGYNHNPSTPIAGIKVKSKVKAGAMSFNHASTRVTIRPH